MSNKKSEKCGEIFNPLRNCLLLRKDAAPAMDFLSVISEETISVECGQKNFHSDI